MMSFVDETFSDSRSISEASRIVGKAEKSSGRSMKSVVVKIRIASAKLAERPTSSTQDGIGRIIIRMTAIRASGHHHGGLEDRSHGFGTRGAISGGFPLVADG